VNDCVDRTFVSESAIDRGMSTRNKIPDVTSGDYIAALGVCPSKDWLPIFLFIRSSWIFLCDVSLSNYNDKPYISRKLLMSMKCYQSIRSFTARRVETLGTLIQAVNHPGFGQVSISSHRGFIWQTNPGVPNLLWPRIPSAFRQMSMYT